jgi:hypothetical protein
MQNMGPKPGYLTTEFYSMLLANGVAILLSLGVLTPHQAQTVNDAAPQIGAIILFIVANASYILTRFGLKLPWEHALAVVAATPAPASLPADPPTVAVPAADPNATTISAI